MATLLCLSKGACETPLLVLFRRPGQRETQSRDPVRGQIQLPRVGVLVLHRLSRESILAAGTGRPSAHGDASRFSEDQDGTGRSHTALIAPD